MARHCLTHHLTILIGIIIFLSGSMNILGALTGEVVVSSGAEPAFCKRISGNLTELVNGLDTHDKSSLEPIFTPDGFDVFSKVLENVSMTNASPLHETQLLNLPGGGWEVRDIRVKVEMGGTAGSPYQNLVFTLTPEGLISNIRFALELTHYRHILEDGNRLQDFALRQQVLQFIEIFRTAYNRKDLDYLRKIYSDDALIIVGRVVKAQHDLPDMLNSSYLSRDRIEFIRKSKAEYIKSLESVFQNNAFVKVIFDSVNVVRHDTLTNVYGVTLQQQWRSSTYSDTGWVFLMIDFRHEDEPIIHVRSWQPEKFPDGSVLGMYDFKLIP